MNQKRVEGRWADKTGHDSQTPGGRVADMYSRRPLTWHLFTNTHSFATCTYESVPQSPKMAK